MIHLDERLRCAFDLLQGAKSVADIGCDHGKLSAALLLNGGCARVIAGDISPDCLQKTSRLIERFALKDRAEVRLGSGLAILAPGECDAVAILGMGGELVIEILEASPAVAESLDRLVLQPMSGIDKLRRWLYENRYHVKADRLVPAGRRWYQVICVQKREDIDSWPERFPEECYLVGYRSFRDKDERLGDYCKAQLRKRHLLIKQAAGAAGETKLVREAGQLERIMEEIELWI
jgi:tRNA (adenine22-N1)-methyltransferase